MNWIHAPTEGNGLSPFQVMLASVRGAGWLGHSFGGFVHDWETGKGYSGQWGMAGEAGVSLPLSLTSSSPCGMIVGYGGANMRISALM